MIHVFCSFVNFILMLFFLKRSIYQRLASSFLYYLIIDRDAKLGKKSVNHPHTNCEA